MGKWKTTKYQFYNHPGPKAWVGYQKITPCCLQAAADGFDYMWIDTCCIDRTSSSELSGAINSCTSDIASKSMLNVLDGCAKRRGSLTGGEISIVTRTSWASKRDTTREEDVAYCLKGIFGVNMPIWYGEGQNALMRRQRRTIKFRAIIASPRELQIRRIISRKKEGFLRVPLSNSVNLAPFTQNRPSKEIGQ